MEEGIKKHSFKIQIGTMVSVVIFIVGVTWWAADNKGTIFAEIEEIKEQGKTNKEHILELESGAKETDMNMVEIKTKLNFIETTLVEIKNRMISKDYVAYKPLT